MLPLYSLCPLTLEGNAWVLSFSCPGVVPGSTSRALPKFCSQSARVH